MAADISQLLAFGVKNKASDLHLSSGVPPMIRVDGDVRRINMPALEHKDVHDMVYDIMNDKQRKDYEEFLECDFSFEIPNLARFRVNAFNQNRGSAAVFRTIPSKILSLEDLGAPAIFKEISDNPRGIVLVTGPTGSGKSTTLAGMINYKNESEFGHILTIEDPIEFVHESKKCLINQREVHRDTLGFSEALRSALREDPDVILVGEMRDLETIRLALSGAETGHLVFGTLHTSSAAKTMRRCIPPPRPANSTACRPWTSACRTCYARASSPRKMRATRRPRRNCSPEHGRRRPRGELRNGKRPSHKVHAGPVARDDRAQGLRPVHHLRFPAGHEGGRTDHAGDRQAAHG
jgi:pilus retraction protein PilT